MTYHGPNKGVVKMNLLPNGGCFQVQQKTFGFIPQVWHGIFFTLTWTYLGVVEVYTGRYLRWWWRKRHLVHSVVGSVALGLTVIGYLIIVDAMGWKLWWHNFHCVSSIIGTWLGWLMMALGIANLYLLKKVKLEWQTRKLMWF